MPAQHLRAYGIDWAWPHVDHDAFGSNRGLSRGQAVRDISKAVQAFNPLTALISQRLQKEKPITSPAVGWAKSEIAFFDFPGTALSPVERGKPLQLTTRYWLDPMSLLDLPQDKRVIGALAVTITEDFCSAIRGSEKLGFLSGTPFFVFDEAMKEFEDADYTLVSLSSQKPLDGTDLKVRYRLTASTVETRVTLILVKGRTELWERDVRVLRAGLMDNAATFTTLEDGRLRVHGMLPESIEPSSYILLDDLPPEVRKHL